MTGTVKVAFLCMVFTLSHKWVWMKGELKFWIFGSEDTKQDAWFTQSAFDVGFSWMEKVFPNFQVNLFSGKYHCLDMYVLHVMMYISNGVIQ